MGENLATLLRQTREQRGYSLRLVESETKVSNAYLSQLERGIITEPSPHVLHRLAVFYKIPYESLMEAAGYIVPKASQKTTESGGIAMAAKTAHLSRHEEQMVSDFIKMLVQNRKRRNG
jgi:transcriptional regulator with XRE-family HTH domain